MSGWEVCDVDEEPAGADEEVAGADEEVADKEEEVVEEDEEVVAKPVGDPCEKYVLGLAGTPPEIPNTIKWLECVQSHRQYKRLTEEARRSRGGLSRSFARMARRFEEMARRYGDLAYTLCPYRPHRCPLYSYAARCPVSMERACRARARRRVRRVR